MSAQEPPDHGATVEVPGGPLWRNRPFVILWSAHAFSDLGDAFAFVALPLLVLETTGSATQMGLVTGLFGVSRLLAGVLAGALADAVEPRRLMMACAAGRAAAYGAVPLVWWLWGPNTAVIFALSVSTAVLGVIFETGSVVTVTRLVEKAHFAAATGHLQASAAVLFLIGPALAGLASDRFGLTSTLAVNALLTVAAGACLLLLPPKHSALDRQDDEERMTARSLLVGLRFIMQAPVLRSLALLNGAMALAAGAGIDLYVVYLKNDVAQDDRAVGLVFASASLGTIAGALLTPAIRRRLGFAWTFFAPSVVAGLAVSAIGLTHHIVAIAGFAMLFALASVIAGVNAVSYRQECTPHHLMGRVSSGYSMLVGGPAPIGAAVGSALADRVGAGPVLCGMGLVMAAISALGLLTPLRTVKESASITVESEPTTPEESE